MRSLVLSLIQCNWYLYKKRRSEHRNTARKDHVKTQRGEDAIYTPSREDSVEINPAATLTLDF